MAAKPPRDQTEPPDAPKDWGVFRREPGLVLGFHGCDRSVADKVLSGKGHLKPSSNKYDWLGGGIYFWESDPWRAWMFAHECMTKKHLTAGVVKNPYVIGAVIDLGHCFNLLSVSAVQEVRGAHDYLEAVYKVFGEPMPANKGFEMGARFLDRAVIDTVHQQRKRRKISPYDSVRAAYLEGDDLYLGAGFKSRNHIQIAVCEPSRILGYFRLPGL